MKNIKKFFIFVSICLLITFFQLSTIANAKKDTTNAKVVDDAKIFSTSEKEKLEKKANSIVDAYDVDFVIVTMNENITDDDKLRNYAQEYYNNNGYGKGKSNDGVILLIDMNSRKVATQTIGEAQNKITEYGKSCLTEALTPKMKKNKYAAACEEYITVLEDHLKQAKTGKPYDTNNKYKSKSAKIKSTFILMGVALIISLIAVLIMKASLKNARPQRAANDYVKSGSFKVDHRQDIYLRTTVTKTKIEKNSSSNSSGSSGSGDVGSF